MFSGENGPGVDRLARERQNRAMPQKMIVTSTAAPAAIGPYSQAVRVGNLVYTSGQVGFDPATGNLVEGGIAEQTERVCENLRAVLNAVDLTLTDVIKTTVFLQDMNDFSAMNEVYARHFAPENYVPPARSTVQVAKLPRGGLVEIECIAMVGLDH
jgi:2-iminobutanoate/2-iminopropanoate deaminase